MIYLDSSALVKLVHHERETSVLRIWLSERSDEAVVSSDLARVEVLRATPRIDEEMIPEAASLLDSIDLIPIDQRVIEAASAVQPPLRSLDAIRLATALQSDDMISTFVSYEDRLRAAASAAGLTVAAPAPDDSRPDS